MDIHPSVQSPEPLRFLAAKVQFPCGNTLLHQLVVDNSLPNKASCASYMNAVLRSMSDIPSNIANALNNGRKSALDLAVMKNNPEMVGKLLSCLANIDANARCQRARSRLIKGDTALHLAANKGYLSVVQELLDHGANMDAMNDNHETPLCYAVRSGHLDVLRLLVSNGAQLNPRDAKVTPLCYAVHSGNLEALKFLLDGGAVMNACQGCVAARSKDLAIAEVLENCGAVIDVKDSVARYTASFYMPSKKEYKEFLSFKSSIQPELHTTIGYTNTPLHLASSYGLHIMKCVVACGVDVNARNIVGETPLHYAVKGKHLECVSFLMDCGASFQADVNGWTPLHVAAHNGRAEIVRLLLARGANAKARDGSGRTPLCVAKPSIAPLLR